MLSWLLLTASLFGDIAAATKTSMPEHQATDHVKNIEFLGFSANNQACAWLITVAQPQPSSQAIDSYKLVKIIDPLSKKPLGVFRASRITRRNQHGQMLRTPSSKLAQSNPTWQKAKAISLWQKAARHWRFSAVTLEFKDSLVRLLPDPDSHFLPKARDKKIHTANQPGEPLGYTPIARLFKGELIALGHYRFEPPANTTVQGSLQVFHSHNGRLLAVLNRMDIEHADEALFKVAIVTTPSNNPIASVAIGTVNMMKEQARGVEDDFKSMHPNSAAEYDLFVDKL